jgi:hypothetical protein
MVRNKQQTVSSGQQAVLGAIAALASPCPVVIHAHASVGMAPKLGVASAVNE